MGIFDSLIGEVAERFGLGSKAGPLLSALLSLVTSRESGGITGFLAKFQNAGLTDVVSSWIGMGENKALSAGQLESALGSDVIRGLAEKAGLPVASAAPALAFLAPGIINKLTPNGSVPTTLPESISSYLTGALGSGLGAITGAAGAVGAGLSGMGDKMEDAASAVGAGAASAARNLGGAAGAVGAGALGAASAAAGIAGETAKTGASWIWRVLPCWRLPCWHGGDCAPALHPRMRWPAAPSRRLPWRRPWFRHRRLSLTSRRRLRQPNRKRCRLSACSRAPSAVMTLSEP
ncbi:MAG: YidB family protein [Blastocatellia bacterium]